MQEVDGSIPFISTSLRPYVYKVEDCHVEAPLGVDGPVAL